VKEETVLPKILLRQRRTEKRGKSRGASRKYGRVTLAARSPRSCGDGGRERGLIVSINGKRKGLKQKAGQLCLFEEGPEGKHPQMKKGGQKGLGVSAKNRKGRRFSEDGDTSEVGDLNPRLLGGENRINRGANTIQGPGRG